MPLSKLHLGLYLFQHFIGEAFSIKHYLWGFPAQMVKNLPGMPETWVRSLGQDDSLEKGTATHSSILAWRIPWTEEPGELQSMQLQRVGQD